MTPDSLETVTARFRQWVDHRDGEDVPDTCRDRLRKMLGGMPG